jgi:hypothetical protein
MVLLSPNLSLDEFITSKTATEKSIDNKLPDELLASAQVLAVNLFEPIRHLLGDMPLHIDSGYRCPELNSAVGGVPTSQHMLAQALDLTSTTISVRDMIRLLIQSNISYDQIIEEGTWLHVSYRTDNPTNNRHEILLTKDHKTYIHLSKEQALEQL